MSEDSYSGGGRSPKMSYRQLQQHMKKLKDSFKVADRITPKIRDYEQQEAQEADATIDSLLQSPL